MSSPKVAATNFTVLRVRRDVLQCSSIGALFTNRSVSTAGAGSNQVFGVDANFNPEVVFLRRTKFRSNYGSLRFSPRPRRNGTIRQYFYETSVDYITNDQNQLESRGVTASGRIDLQNSDTLGLTYLRESELLERPFVPAAGITVPAGRYAFQHVRAAWSPGQQHRL